MLYILLFIALGIAVYFGVRYFLIKKSIKEINNELQEITLDLGENRIVKLPSPDKNVEDLLDAVNSLLKSMREEVMSFGHREVALKSQIEFISHDLRTPLTSIQGYLALIDTSDLDDEGLESMQVIERKTDSLQRLIVQFYELSQLEHEAEQFKVQHFDAAYALKESLASYYHVFTESHIEVTASIPEVPVEALAHPEAFERICANLLQNASRYALSQLEIMLDEDDNEVRITFRNDSEFFDHIDSEQLFEAFYVHDSSRSQGSSGLGLAIARRLAESMNARLEAVFDEDHDRQFVSFILTLRK